MTARTALRTLDELPFTNTFTRELVGDESDENRPRQVRGALWSPVTPTPVAAPELIAESAEMAATLGIDLDADRERAARVLTGTDLVEGSEPYAMRYGGHQFGNWAGQLGDGRAIALGEVAGADGGHWTLQLKGSGRTPYSRGADGLAVLRSSVREFLCSEAMHHLGVPTTRALSLCLTGEQVVRDMFYDGHPKEEPGAIVCRVAPSFVRIGSFEILAASGEEHLLRSLADHVITRDFPHLGEPSTGTYLAWFREIVDRTARLMVDWQRVGFVHGVMNTDNLSVLGLTIDYGPYGWLEDYDPDWTPNTTDAHGRRYRYGHQPEVAWWNLVQLANAIYPLIGEVEPLQDAIEGYRQTFESAWAEAMAAKLGLAGHEGEGDDDLVTELWSVLQAAETDMTIFFRDLADVAVESGGWRDADDRQLLAPLLDAYYRPEQLDDEVTGRIAGWLRRWAARVASDGTPDGERARRMDAVNPRYVLRNYLAQLAIDDAERGDHAHIAELLDVLRAPYDDQPGRERFAERRPEWARTRAGCSMLSCSS
ncbi:MAG: YdiU family protein [Actinomycetota bacterium]